MPKAVLRTNTNTRNAFRTRSIFEFNFMKNPHIPARNKNNRNYIWINFRIKLIRYFGAKATDWIPGIGKSLLLKKNMCCRLVEFCFVFVITEIKRWFYLVNWKACSFRKGNNAFMLWNGFWYSILLIILKLRNNFCSHTRLLSIQVKKLKL